MSSNMNPLSGSMQMYLVSIARLRQGDDPVPLSLLADTLDVSPVSVNEMCRKLQDLDLVVYRPYKGATLTKDGERRALAILRRHRLWEVFLVRELGFAYDEAHDVACNLEHATPVHLADRLDGYLGHPHVNPQGEPIPGKDGDIQPRPAVPLTALAAGEAGHVLRIEAQGAERPFLEDHGIRPGAPLKVLATTQESVLVQVAEAPMALGRNLAQLISIDTEEVTKHPIRTSVRPTSRQETANMASTDQATVHQVTLDTLRVGQKGVVVRVGSLGPAKRRMMDMGLVPGTPITVQRVAPLGDPIEFTLKGYSLSLRKSEAREVIVEVKK
jgi:DtxR family transcriptional regulator, Mn-dependent transcriptional regulator